VNLEVLGQVSDPLGQQSDLHIRRTGVARLRGVLFDDLCLLGSIHVWTPSGALHGGGLDPRVGFLHADRPGRDSLAQDILEEFRAWWADRLVLSLINRGQIKPQDFVTEASGAVSLKADARKLLFQALQAKKQEKIVHPFLGEEVEIGLLPYIQAMLLARHLRGDLAEYPPFLMR